MLCWSIKIYISGKTTKIIIVAAATTPESLKIKAATAPTAVALKPAEKRGYEEMIFFNNPAGLIIKIGKTIITERRILLHAVKRKSLKFIESFRETTSNRA